MGIDRVVVFVLTYFGTWALRKWPEYKNEYLAKAAFVIAIVGEVVTNLMGINPTTPAVNAAYAQVAGPAAAGSEGLLTVGTLAGAALTWAATQVVHLFGEKILVKGIFRVKLPF